MNEDLRQLIDTLRRPQSPLPAQAALRLSRAYPFFTLPAVTALRHHRQELDPDTRRELMQQIALNAPDPATLRLLTDPQRDSWADFYPTRPATVTTDDAITTFLNTYGHSSPAEAALLERLIFNPTPDYSSILSREEEDSLPQEVDPADDSQDALINAFILQSKASGTQWHPAPVEPEPEPETSIPSGPQSGQPRTAEPQPQTARHTPEPPTELNPADHPRELKPDTIAADTSLSESLAKIYIKQKRYDKAFEIIHNLSLNNPKKSVYFADQLRFLRKLMLNRRFSDPEAASDASI